VLALSQLVACGFTKPGVASLVQSRRLHRIHRGVYALGPATLTPEGNWMAAVLACGPGSLLAGLSVGAHYRLITYAGALVDVAATRRVRQPGIRAHALTLADADRSEHLGIPCTSVARTLLEIAARRPDVLSALEHAERLGIFDLHAINDVLARTPGHRGVRRLRHGLTRITAGPALPERVRTPDPADLSRCRAAGPARQSHDHARGRPDRGRLLLADITTRR
jgi:hypothetical protein